LWKPNSKQIQIVIKIPLKNYNNSILKDTNSVVIHCQNILRNVSIETLMALGMITVFVNVMTKGSIMEVMNQKTDKNDYSIVFYAILGYEKTWLTIVIFNTKNTSK